jgi:hypothetical protein
VAGGARGLIEPSAKEKNTRADPGLSEVKLRRVPDFLVNIILLMRLEQARKITVQTTDAAASLA